MYVAYTNERLGVNKMRTETIPRSNYNASRLSKEQNKNSY